MILSEHGVLSRVDDLSDVPVDIEQVASAFVLLLASKCLLHDYFLFDLGHKVVVHAPPHLQLPIIHVRVVVPVFCKPIMDHNCVQLIRLLFVLNIWFFDLLFKFLNFFFENLNFRVLSFFVLGHDFQGKADLIEGNSKV